MTFVPFSKITIKKQKRRKPKKWVKQVIGFDTETDKNGDLVLLCDSEGRMLRFYHDKAKAKEVLIFLTKKEYQARHCVFFNLSFDESVILKLLPKKNLTELTKTGQTIYEGYFIKWIPKKMLSINKGKNKYVYCDIAQFYDGSLEKCAVKYLGNEYRKIKEDVKGKTRNDYYLRAKEYQEYCVNDALLTKKLAEKRLDDFKQLGVEPQFLISTAYMSEMFFRQNCYVPSINNIDKKILEIAHDNYLGGRFELLQRGFFPKVFEYDIKSAYPHIIQQLPDFNKGGWVHSKHERPKRTWSFVRIQVWTNPKHRIQPILKRDGNRIIAPIRIGDEVIISQEELDVFKKSKAITKYKFIEGWYYYGNLIYRPYRHIIPYLYGKKEQCKKEGNTSLGQVVKIILNSFYGKTFQKVKKGDEWITGQIYNPIYAYFITALCRLQLYQAVVKKQYGIIQLATDGIISTQPLKLVESEKLGDWESKTMTDFLAVQCGVNQCLSQKYEPVFKFRGLRPLNFNEIPPIYRKIPIVKLRPLKVKECVIQKREDEIAQFVEVEKVLDINGDVKRNWDRAFKNVGDMFESRIKSKPLTSVYGETIG